MNGPIQVLDLDGKEFQGLNDRGEEQANTAIVHPRSNPLFRGGDEGVYLFTVCIRPVVSK